jgi:hypothetical protein
MNCLSVCVLVFTTGDIREERGESGSKSIMRQGGRYETRAIGNATSQCPPKVSKESLNEKEEHCFNYSILCV